MSTSDILMILVTALSPVTAVQVTRRLDDRNEERGRKLQIFKTLMATRAYTLSSKHVEALNQIDLEFPVKKRAEKPVVEVWLQYLDHLGDKAMSPENWAEKRVNLLVELLYAMARALGYDFNKTQIKNGTYAPVAHGRLEEEQQKVRELVIEVLEGKRSLPMLVANLPNQKNEIMHS